MALSIEGKLDKLCPVLTGEGKNGTWTRQDFILETFGEYPKKICLSTWNEKAKETQSLASGSLLKVTFSAESREYNERWYTDLRAYNIALMGSQQQGITNQQPPATQTQQPTDAKGEGEEEESDDLQF